MFGFLRHRAQDRRNWRLHYCGTCKTIGTLYGQRSRMLLNHDAAFLAELLDAVAGTDAETWSEEYRSWNCLRMPANPPVLLRYVAAVNVLLGDYKVRDHETDSGARRWRLARRYFSRPFRKARRDLESLGFSLEQADRILARQEGLEKTNVGVDAPTAEVTALVFAHGAHLAGLSDSRFSDLGRAFGRLIYFVDAWEDFDRDSRSGAFNALRAAGKDRAWGAALIRTEADSVCRLLEEIGAPATFVARVRGSLHDLFGSPFRVVHTCARPTLRDRWRGAVARTRSWQTPLASFLIVALLAFLFEREARLARSARECLSLSMNLMAFGGLIAMAAGDVKKTKFKACVQSCCCGWDPECDWCCDSCCCDIDCCCSCDSCDCCSGCDC